MGARQDAGGAAAEIAVARLPVLGRAVALRAPTGAEDLLLAEAPAGAPGLALALVSRLARPCEGPAIDWAGLAVPDLDALLLRLRQALAGDRIRTDVPCPAPGCGRRFDLSFAVSDYLAHHRPGRPRHVTAAEEAGWYCLAGTAARFRLPTAGDQAEVAGRPDAEAELRRRCLRPAGLPRRLARRAEAAMEVLAPSLSSELSARCPECGADVEVAFDAQLFTLEELRQQSAFVYEEVSLLAQAHHWAEADILALPRPRRQRYAALARPERRRA